MATPSPRAVPPARRRRSLVRATLLPATEASLATVADHREDEAIGRTLDAVRAVAGARELDDLAAAVRLCRRLARDLRGVP